MTHQKERKNTSQVFPQNYATACYATHSRSPAISRCTHLTSPHCEIKEGRPVWQGSREAQSTLCAYNRYVYFCSRWGSEQVSFPSSWCTLVFKSLKWCTSVKQVKGKRGHFPQLLQISVAGGPTQRRRGNEAESAWLDQRVRLSIRGWWCWSQHDADYANLWGKVLRGKVAPDLRLMFAPRDLFRLIWVLIGLNVSQTVTFREFRNKNFPTQLPRNAYLPHVYFWIVFKVNMDEYLYHQFHMGHWDNNMQLNAVKVKTDNWKGKCLPRRYCL